MNRLKAQHSIRRESGYSTGTSIGSRKSLENFKSKLVTDTEIAVGIDDAQKMTKVYPKQRRCFSENSVKTMTPFQGEKREKKRPLSDNFGSLTLNEFNENPRPASGIYTTMVPIQESEDIKTSDETIQQFSRGSPQKENKVSQNVYSFNGVDIKAPYGTRVDHDGKSTVTITKEDTTQPLNVTSIKLRPDGKQEVVYGGICFTIPSNGQWMMNGDEIKILPSTTDNTMLIIKFERNNEAEEEAVYF